MSEYTIKVMQDTDAESPRAFDCNMGLMACWHRRYKLGDVEPKQTSADWLEDNAPEGSIILPLYLMDHSGISMSTDSFNDSWDSGKVGVIVATPAKIRECFALAKDAEITEEIRAKATENLKGEVSTYDDFIRGNVWGYVIEAHHTCGECGSMVDDDDGDSCWGFIGSDKSTLEAMKEHVDKKHHAALEAAWDKRF